MTTSERAAASPAGHAGGPTGYPRVCLVIGQLGLGGSEKQVVLLADGLKRHGFDVSVAVLVPGGEREADLVAAGVPIVHIGRSRRRGRWRWTSVLSTGWQCAAGVARLVRYLRRQRPQIVHAYLFLAHAAAAPAARLARVPVVVAGRRSLDFYSHGRPLVRIAERVATAMTDLLVANADAVAACVRTAEGVPAERLRVIYNGLAPSAFRPVADPTARRPAELDSALPLVVYVANLWVYKGHCHLVDALHLLRERGLPCTLALVGAGPERAALERRILDLGVDARLLGARTDVDRLLPHADVAVSASLTEGMSNFVMEAMAAGRPVVATAVGGTPELLADGRGLLVPPADAVALADAVERLLRDRAAAERMAEAARQWSLTHLHVDSMVRQHVDLYHQLLER